MLSLSDTISVSRAKGFYRSNPAALKTGNFFCIGLLVAVAGMMLIGSFWAGQIRSKNADAQMRQRLLSQATEIAHTLNPELVRKLTFTAADKGTPAFEQIREQMITAGTGFSQRGIYSMVYREGKVFFGPGILVSTRWPMT